MAGLTAWFSLIEMGRRRADETVLLSGTGGVALFALQIAMAHGADVLITSSSDEKLKRAKTLGAAHGINRNAADVVQEVLSITRGRGADHVLELVGGENLVRSIKAVSVGGRISIIGLLGGNELSAPTTPILLKAPVMQGIVTGHRRALDDFVRAVDLIELKPVIDRRYAFGELRAALDHLDSGAFGKIVIDMSAMGAA